MKISQERFKQRRISLMEQMAPESIAIIPSGQMITRNNDAETPKDKNTDWYLATQTSADSENTL